MWDLFLRVLKHPADFLPGFTKHKIYFVKKQQEAEGIYSFYFRFNKAIHWKAGQHGLFFPNTKIEGKQWRVFSIVSIPQEQVIRITTSAPPEPSPFKQHLQSLSPNDVMFVRGPVGEMHYTSNQKQVVAIAGGIGITPFRALIKEKVHTGIKTFNFHLIHANKDDNHLFKAELAELTENDETIELEYVNTPDEVNAAIEEQVKKHGNTANYFLSGSPRMIEGITKQLHDLGVTNITNDPFKGY